MKLAIIGDPVDHSRSPEIYRRFLRNAEIDGTYVAIRTPSSNAISVIRRMRLDEYNGVNVTYPLKEEAVRACDTLTEEAQRANAVNTVFFGREIIGHNTDGIGARAALESAMDEESVALKRIGVLGYGATARAILAQLQENDAYTFVWGRDAQRVVDACARYDAQAWPFENPPEIVVSTLPPNTRLEPKILESVIHADIVMDTNYGSRTTLHRQLDREVVPGDAMLEAQAEASFDFWLAHIDGVAPEEKRA
ncbi:MAG: hypothetical protein M3R51_09670 [Candidatus Eremiobacteraeota bacterium]|nr:hypothetical protein [Candidatus Eremiobacteraeota bacterium]